MDRGTDLAELAALLRQLRLGRGVSMLQLADAAGVEASVAQRAENGADARLSTWVKLFEGLGYRLRAQPWETCEEAAGLLEEEADRRRERRIYGRTH
jgi:transcriptional regulator with XRE-family HTH domain